jgi:hypothetical protein
MATAVGEQSRAMAAARRASERAAMRLTDVHAVFTAGPELAPGQVVGGPAGSIPGVAASDVFQAGLDHRAAEAPEAVAGTGHFAAHLWAGLL